uniref:CUB domain containing protein 1a n=1 Tax=Seriola dumerili TaxID=41447 RepID=A0A3B4UXV4_SERDU
TPERGTTVNISSTVGKSCEVCRREGRSNRCSTSLVFKDNAPVSVEFRCARNVLTVEISRNIGKSTADSGSLPLLDFNRKFTWNLNASAPKAFKIDFTKTGLRQIPPSERCPDGHSYTLQALQTTGKVAVGKYCTAGTISSAQILNLVSFTLFLLALAKITVTLPKGTSSSELLSPNYPDSFPDDDVMEWYFQVPKKHKTDIQFMNLTQPSCRKKETAVEYHSKGRAALVLSLTEVQPHPNWGNFSMTLRNCEMDRGRAGSPGLSLSVKVSTSNTMLCKVDLRKAEGLSLYIEKLRPASDCEMKINSVTKEKITVTSNSDLSFQDCLPEDVRVTAMRVIGKSRFECLTGDYCPKTPVRLSLPALPSCLPAPLSSVTWILRPPQHGTVELTSPTGPLKQSLPGQPCNDSVLVKLAEDDGIAIGNFCPQGAIKKIQIHTNMSVTVSSMGGKALSMCYKNVLDACFKEEISGNKYIFTVSSKKDTPVLLATPGWPAGMKSYSTVSWIVSVPPKMKAHLMFANLSQPKCSNRHTNIRVQRVNRLEEDYSRREDEETESEIVVSEGFYLNMSNCMPERGHFSVITKLTLVYDSKTLILSSLLPNSKKKKKLNHQVSIYNPSGTIFLPGHTNFPKTREDNESHVYTTIEDTLVYTHLLRKGKETGVYGESDPSYKPFTGHTVSQKPLVSEDSGAEDMEIGVYHPFRYSSQQGPPLPSSQPLLRSFLNLTLKRKLGCFSPLSHNGLAKSLGKREQLKTMKLFSY